MNKDMKYTMVFEPKIAKAQNNQDKNTRVTKAGYKRQMRAGYKTVN